MSALPGRAAEAITAWERALGAAHHPVQTDHARDGLVAALWTADRHDDAVRQLETGLAETRNEAQRAAWLDGRANMLATRKDVEATLKAFDEAVAASGDAGRRLELRLRQAQVATAAGRWRDAAAGFDAAWREIPDGEGAEDRRHALRLAKVQALASHAVDTVLADLDALDVTWPGPGWPPPIDLRVAGLLAAGRTDEAAAWLAQRLASTDLADHPAAHQ
jgi:tetratricopeptide (TPR) repeat protein